MTILAAGIIVYRLINDKPVFLLLKNSVHGAWGFPKGHLESDEDPMRGAVRECREETGIQITKVHEGFCKQTRYICTPFGSSNKELKKTLYYLSHADSDEIRISKEHSEYVWNTRLEGRKRLQFDNLRDILDCAYSAVLRRLNTPHEDLVAATDLLDELSNPDDIWRKHCLKVAQIGKKIGQALLQVRPVLPVDLVTLEASALLHDIGRSIDHGIDHPKAGTELLTKRGLFHLAKPCLSHWLKGRKRKSLEGHDYFTPKLLETFFKTFNLDEITLSEKIISVADAIVQHDKPVRLSVRYKDARARYGDSKWIRDNERISRDFINEIEGILGVSIYETLKIE